MFLNKPLRAKLYPIGTPFYLLRSVLLISALFILFSCSTDDGVQSPENPDETSEQEEITEPETPTIDLDFTSFLDVSYGADTEQVYDIYLPAGRTENTKTLILVHGGGWTSGDKADMNDFKDFLRSQLPDVAIVNMNYRLADSITPPYPMQTDDITMLVEELDVKKSEYQIGTELGFLGISAGGHLSLLWSYAFDEDNQVNMVCSIVGPTNLLDEAYRNTEDELLSQLVTQFDLDEEILREASPLFQVTEDAPPTSLFYGGKDPLVPISQGVDLDARLMELGIEHEFTLYENEGHGWIGLNLLDTSVKLRTFIEKHL